MKINLGEKIFKRFNYVILGLIAFIALYPVIYVFSASISSSHAVSTGKVLLFPKEITWIAYKNVLQKEGIWIGYANTIFYTLVGTAVNLFVTICGAYPLSKRELPGRKFFTLMIVVTMWLDAGIIPFFLNLRDLGLLDKRITIIIAFACSTFNVILLRTFFESIPRSLEEAAKIDGANDFRVLRKVYLPLSKPALATVGLFYAVTRWNGYFWSMVILKDNDKIPLQVVLKKMIVEMSVSTENMDVGSALGLENLIYATIIVSIVPMMMLYPYIQKYFSKGVMIGAIKG